MASLASILSGSIPAPGRWQSAFVRANHQPHGLGRAAAGSAELALAAGDARSFSAQLIVERISVRMTSVTQTAPPTQEVFSPSDFSSEATAQRIFTFSISLFGVYQSQNSDESTESALASFEQLVRDAIDEGFGEARGILDELGRLDEEIAEFMDATYSILDRLLDEFFQTGEEGGESEVAGPLGESYFAALEFEYQYLHIETLSVSGSSASGAQSISMEYMRVYAESISFSLTQGESASEPALQLIA